MHSELGTNGIGAWRPDLTAKVRVLLHAKPLFDLKRGDSLRSPDLRHYDTLTLAIKICDLIVDNMGLESEVNRTTILNALEPLLVKMDQAESIQPDHQRHKAIVEHVVGALSNDLEHRRPFSAVYPDFDNHGAAIHRQMDYRLVSDYFHPAGGTVLRLSNEAINLYLRALDLDIEDAQAAAEAVVLSQLNRGKFDEAVQSAKHAYLQTLRYWDKITRVVRVTRRDVHRVDWREEVPKLLDEALQHIKMRTNMEASILQTARDNLQVLDHEEESSHAVAEVCGLVEECRKRHFDLHGQLMDARNVFLDEQERQAFHPWVSENLPSLSKDVLEPLLSMSRIDAATVLNDAAAPLIGAVPPQLVSLKGLIKWMLQPRRPARTDETPIEDVDLVECGRELLRFPDEIRDRGDSILQEIEFPTSLSQLLAVVSDWDGPAELEEYIVLSVLRHFAPEDEDVNPISVYKHENDRLRAPRFAGDELVIASKRDKDDHPTQ